ncbi:MAG: DivIVA domain-containing protein [Oscillospiraceae bacterium]|nr:DivIVA domain-containing protein [Oscillospiraceae bacterium]
MRTPDEIRNTEFQKSAVGGYKMSDVEIFMEEVASEVEILARQKIESDKRLAEIQKKLDECISSQSSIQNVLVSAQRLADQIVEEANQKANQILSAADETAAQVNVKSEMIIKETERKAIALKDATDSQAAKILGLAVGKSESMISAAHDSVARQQLLFDRLRVEIASFKRNIVSMYKSQLELITKLPDEVPFDATRAAEAIAFEYDKSPDFSSFVNEQECEPEMVSSKDETINTIETISEEEPQNVTKEVSQPEQQPVLNQKNAKVMQETNGFVVSEEGQQKSAPPHKHLSFGVENSDEEPVEATHGFFKKHK